MQLIKLIAAAFDSGVAGVVIVISYTCGSPARLDDFTISFDRIDCTAFKSLMTYLKHHLLKLCCH